MRILAIDPGYERLGIAVIDDSNTLLHSECFKTSIKLPHELRLGAISARIKEVVAEFKPKALAIEKLFFNTNQKTAIKVSESRGVILAEAAAIPIPVFEYTPLQVKIAVTGYGRSDKRQVMIMVSKLIKIPDKKYPAKQSDDELDAIAIGLTHLASAKLRNILEKS